MQELRGANKDFIYLCDPVLGDNGLLYVPEEMVGAYKKILHIPNILTPNQFELELLTGLKVESIDDALVAINTLHALGPQTIVLTSSQLGNNRDLTRIESGNVCKNLYLDPIKHQFNSILVPNRH